MQAERWPYSSSKYAAEGGVMNFLAVQGNHGKPLRFFKVIGTTAPESMENSVQNILPIVINKLKAGQAPVIHGSNSKLQMAHA